MAGFDEILKSDGGVITEFERIPIIFNFTTNQSGLNYTASSRWGIKYYPTVYKTISPTATVASPDIIAKFNIYSDEEETGYSFVVVGYQTSSFNIRGRMMKDGAFIAEPTYFPAAGGNYGWGDYTYLYDPLLSKLAIVLLDDRDSGTGIPYASSGALAQGCLIDIDKLLSYLASYYGLTGNLTMGKSSLYSPEYGDASKEGGYTGGTFDDSSDVIALPTAPTLGVSSAGFVNIYNPTAGALQGLGSELFPDLTFTPDAPISGTGGVTEAIEAMATALVNFGNQIPNIVNMYINSNLIQYVIDCHIIPVRPSTAGAQAIKIGFKTFNPTATVVNSDYVDFDCGTLEIGEYYANFIDYAPYTKAKLFLPFVGFVDLAPEFFQGGRLNVTYRFNIIDGSFMAFVRSTSSKSNLSDSVVMQFGGNACVHIPLTGLNYSSMVSGVVSGAAAVMSAQSGVQAATKAVNSAVDVANSKPPLQQSNGYNATTSFLGVRVPYLLIERSVSNFSTSYTDEEGLPSNISTAFSALSGFTQASAVHLDGIDGATSEELEEIRRLLSEGVIF